jgi:hypothetical protein
MLTNNTNTATINPLFPHEAAGIINPFKLGQKMTAPFAVFFRLSFRAALVPVRVLVRLYSVMADCTGLLSSRPRLVAVLITPCNLPPSYYQSCVAVYPFLTRIHRMNTSNPTGNRAHPQGNKQNPIPTPLFSVFSYRQPIAQGINGTLAIRLKRRFPALVVKFQSFEGVL